MSKSKIMGDIWDILREYETFFISSHVNPDGDAIGSQLALYSFLSELGKKATIVNSDPVPSVYSFLPYAEVISDQSKDGYLSEVAIILDCGNLSRIGKELSARVHPRYALINIDHHVSNSFFGTHNLVDADACATAELIIRLMEYGDVEVGLDRAMCLYTAILTDTGSFRYTNTNAAAHRISAGLIEEGIHPDKIAELVYEVVPYRKAKLFGMALETLQLSPDGSIAYMQVTKEMHEQTGTGSEETDGFIDYVRSLQGIELALFFRETEKGDIKVSLRSKSNLNVNRIATAFGGGGHQAAAGCITSEPMHKAIKEVLEAVTAEKGRNRELE